MDIKIPEVLTDAQQRRVDVCKACPSYLVTRALNLQFEKCRVCGCYVRLKVLQGDGACPEKRW